MQIEKLRCFSCGRTHVRVKMFDAYVERRRLEECTSCGMLLQDLRSEIVVLMPSPGGEPMLRLHVDPAWLIVSKKEVV